MPETNGANDDTWITFADHANGAWTLSMDDREAAHEERLIERQDWNGLVKLRRRQATECPCPLCAAGLAEALIAGARFEEALAVLGPVEQEVPGDPLVTELVLNCLHLLGRELHDFPWTLVPRLARLDASALELCFRHLTHGTREVTVGALRQAVFAGAYLDFTEEQLAAALHEDARFAMGTDAAGRTTVQLS